MSSRERTVEYLKRYGAMIRNARKAANLTQKEIAGEMCISQAIISFIENGYMIPPKYIEDELFRILGNHLYEAWLSEALKRSESFKGV